MENSTSSSSSLSSTTSSTSSTSSQNASPDDSDSFSMAGGDESLTKTQTKPTTTTKHLNSVAANTAFRNYQYFTKQSAVDYKSSSQLIFDVLMQMIEVSFLFYFLAFLFFGEGGERGGIEFLLVSEFFGFCS